MATKLITEATDNKSDRKQLKRLAAINDNTIDSLRQALSILPQIHHLFEAGVFPIPFILATNLSQEDYASVCANSDHCRHIEFKEGTVIFTELFRGAHESIVRLVTQEVMNSANGTIGANSLVDIGSFEITYGDGNHTVQPDSSFRPRNIGITATFLIQVSSLCEKKKAC